MELSNRILVPMIFVHVFLLFMLFSTFTTLIFSQRQLDNEILVANNFLNLALTSLLLVMMAKNKWKNKILHSSSSWLILVSIKLISMPLSVLFFSSYLLSSISSCASSLFFLGKLIRKRYLPYVLIGGIFLALIIVKLIKSSSDIKYVIEYQNFLSESTFSTFECIIQILFVIFLIFYKQVEDNIKIQTIRNFSNVMAHEVLKPLAMIETQLGFLNNQRLDTDAQKTFLELTITCRRIRNRMNFIMQNAKLVSSIQSVTKYNTSIQDVILQCIQNYQRDGLNVSLTAHNDILFHGPKVLIRCICDNMVENAYQHCGVNVKIEITISENHIIFQDNVGGIKQSHLENIFEIFHTSKEHKLGIGLTICKDIVNSYGGNIKCISLEGHHTTFIITLPCPVSPVKIA